MLPTNIRDIVTMNITASWTKAALIDKVRSIINNRISGPVPMQVDEIRRPANGHQWTEDAEYEDCRDDEEEQEVNAIGMHAQCYNCPRRERAKAKAKALRGKVKVTSLLRRPGTKQSGTQRARRKDTRKGVNLSMANATIAGSEDTELQSAATLWRTA
jgi:hypothetical protein